MMLAQTSSGKQPVDSTSNQPQTCSPHASITNCDGTTPRTIEIALPMETLSTPTGNASNVPTSTPLGLTYSESYRKFKRTKSEP